jgi:hypothetical protein
VTLGAVRSGDRAITRTGSEPLVIVRVEDSIDPTLTGRIGGSYENPPQTREQAMELVRLLLGGRCNPRDDDESTWVIAIAGGRRTVTLGQGP